MRAFSSASYKNVCSQKSVSVTVCFLQLSALRSHAFQFFSCYFSQGWISFQHRSLLPLYAHAPIATCCRFLVTTFTQRVKKLKVEQAWERSSLEPYINLFKAPVRWEGRQGDNFAEVSTALMQFVWITQTHKDVAEVFWRCLCFYCCLCLSQSTWSVCSHPSDTCTLIVFITLQLITDMWPNILLAANPSTKFPKGSQEITLTRGNEHATEPVIGPDW